MDPASLGVGVNQVVDSRGGASLLGAGLHHASFHARLQLLGDDLRHPDRLLEERALRLVEPLKDRVQCVSTY